MIGDKVYCIFEIAFELTLTDLAVYMINKLKMFCKQNANGLASGWLFFLTTFLYVLQSACKKRSHDWDTELSGKQEVSGSHGGH